MNEFEDERVNAGLKSQEALTMQLPKERREICANLPKYNPPINTSFVNHNIPTLILSGTYDLQTPTERARRIARSLQNSSLVELRGIVHAPLAESSCAIETYVKLLELPVRSAFNPLAYVPGTKPKFSLEIED